MRWLRAGKPSVIELAPRHILPHVIACVGLGYLHQGPSMDVKQFYSHHGSAIDVGERGTQDIAPEDTEDSPILIEVGFTILHAISTISCFHGSHGLWR